MVILHSAVDAVVRMLFPVTQVLGSSPTTTKHHSISVLQKPSHVVTPLLDLIADKQPLEMDQPAKSDHSTIILRVKTSGSLESNDDV